MIGRLKQALQIKNLTAIKSLASELLANPETQMLGQQVNDYASAFNFAKLRELAEQLEQSSG